MVVTMKPPTHAVMARRASRAASPTTPDSCNSRAMANSRRWAWSDAAPWALASRVISRWVMALSQMRRATARTRSRAVSPSTGASASRAP